LGDAAVSTIMSQLDTVVILSRTIASKGYYPAIDPILSSSSAVNRRMLGNEHYETVTKAIEFLHEHERLERIVAIVGETELSPDDQIIYQRAKKIINYVTQPFYTTSSQTGKKGASVPKNKTVHDMRLIVAGEVDHIEADKFMYIGSIDDAGILDQS